MCTNYTVMSLAIIRNNQNRNDADRMRENGVCLSRIVDIQCKTQCDFCFYEVFLNYKSPNMQTF